MSIYDGDPCFKQISSTSYQYKVRRCHTNAISEKVLITAIPLEIICVFLLIQDR